LIAPAPTPPHLVPRHHLVSALVGMGQQCSTRVQKVLNGSEIVCGPMLTTANPRVRNVSRSSRRKSRAAPWCAPHPQTSGGGVRAGIDPEGEGPHGCGAGGKSSGRTRLLAAAWPIGLVLWSRSCGSCHPHNVGTRGASHSPGDPRNGSNRKSVPRVPPGGRSFSDGGHFVGNGSSYVLM